MTKSDGNGDGGAVHETRVTQLVLMLDHDSMQVTIGGTPCPIALAQMIMDEASRLLTEQRRLAAAQQLGERIKDAARTQQILDSVTGRQRR